MHRAAIQRIVFGYCAGHMGAGGSQLGVVLMSASLPRVRMWLVGFAWIAGAALFIRFAQILPCCAPTPIEVALRSHICQCTTSFVTACPSYEEAARR